MDWTQLQAFAGDIIAGILLGLILKILLPLYKWKGRGKKPKIKIHY